MEFLSDIELLALFPNKPAGLLMTAQGNLQLVFLDGGEGISGNRTLLAVAQH
jgi:hypothetical protein